MNVYYLYGRTKADSKKKEQTIYVRLSYGRNKVNYRASTKLTIKKEGWNFKKGEEAGVVNLMTGSRSIEDSQYFQKVKEKLQNIRNHLKNEFRLLKLKPEFSVMDKQEWNKWAKEHFEIAIGVKEARSNKAEYYLDKFDEWIKHKKNKVSEGTLRGYNSNKGVLQAFMKYKKHNYKTNEIDSIFYDEFQEWCYEERNYTPNYFGLQIAKIKVVMRHFRTKQTGFKYSVQILHPDFETIKETIKHEILNEDELQLLWNYKGKPYLENVRDITILLYRGCLRYSEFFDVINRMDKSIFKYTNKKTNKTFYKWSVDQRKVKKQKGLNLHKQIETMWKENTLPHRIALQKFNDYIKELCLEVGITKAEDVASHTFRRSFCTNMYNDETIDVRSIMEYSGHTTERMLLNYIQDDNVTRNNNIPTE